MKLTSNWMNLMFVLESRDRTLQSKLAEPDILTHLIREAGLGSTQIADLTVYDSECAVESLKCLSNVVFQNPLVISTIKLELLTNNFASDNFADILKQITDMDFLKCQLASDCAQEMLKFLFNLGYAKKELGHSEATYEATYRSLTTVVRDLLVKQTSSMAVRSGIISHCVNFLTTIPVTCYALLLFDPADPPSDSQPPHKDENADTLSPSSGGSSELLTPILNVLAAASRANSVIRKYCRLKVVPFLIAHYRVFWQLASRFLVLARMSLCQAGQAKLLGEFSYFPLPLGCSCRLSKRLTATGATDGVAESTALLIFILCKEKVSRAIKYSGFGNFAGFLARHGLMGGSRPPSEPYSSSSSDSETETYHQLRDDVNPVTGRFEPYKPSPMESMSQEQKEYEAMKLVDKIDKLQRYGTACSALLHLASGIIQPGTIGEDGRVHPVEHVLQLIQDVKVDSSKEGSDSD
ncbi:unnamed protein product [Schistocephalus solidus]|uniref:Synembryn-A n=1 Tax=Schistocephalus solidus TaxID=70667 RepID=A0A183TA88_SCHSO|nr:unnamed protein product [Schistocephalus solidus]